MINPAEHFLLTLYCCAITVFLIGFVFLIRALLIIFFSFDFIEAIRSMERTVKRWLKKLKGKEKEEDVVYIIDEEMEDVFEQK